MLEISKRPSFRWRKNFMFVIGCCFAVFQLDIGASIASEALKVTTREKSVTQSEPAARDGWRQARNCGPVSLYSLATLCDHDTSLSAIQKLAPPGPEGVDLATLKAASQKLGFATTALQFRDPDYLQRLDGPFIAHLNSSWLGHFVVVLHIDDRKVVLGEGISASVRQQSLASFLHDSSGFILVPTSAIWKE